MTERDLLEAFLSAYRRQATRMSFAELCRRQPAPVASLAHGAAGTAYAFLRAFEVNRRAGDLADARRWSSAAWRARARPDACRGRLAPGARRSIFCGPAGLAFVELSVGVSSGRTREGRLQAFMRLCRPRRGAPSEVWQGAAGGLCACAGLFAATDDGRLRALGDRLAMHLLEAGRPSSAASLGFAHGVVGIHHALLRWSEVTGFELPARFFRSLDRIAGTPLSAYPAALAHSWCNGSAGVALLMAAAFRVTARPAYRARARAAATHATRDEGRFTDLCCGLAGRAYAALALDAIDPGRGWRARSLRLAARACAEFASTHPNGLLKGAPGLVCLALDLLSDRPRGFPIVEG